MAVLLALLGLPLVEIALFVVIGGAIGLWPTLACVVLSAALGLSVLRGQGLQAMTRLQASMARGEDPAGPMADGAMLMLAGLLLLAPGFLTDAVGAALLFAPVRARVFAFAGPRMARRVVVVGGLRPGGPPPRQDGDIPIEAEYRDVTDQRDPPPRGG